MPQLPDNLWLSGVRVTSTPVLPSGIFALTLRDKVVWDSATQQPAGLPNDLTKWDGVLLASSDFQRLAMQQHSVPPSQ